MLDDGDVVSSSELSTRLPRDNSVHSVHSDLPVPGAFRKSLLQDIGVEKISFYQLCSNMILSIIGTVVLGIYAQIRIGGWIIAPTVIILGFLIISEMTSIVSETIDALNASGEDVISYQDFAGGALGKWGRNVSSVTSTLALMGMICNGLILEAQNLQFATNLDLPSILPCPGCSKDDRGNHFWAIMLSLTTAFYVSVDFGALLKKLAFIGPFVCFFCVVFAVAGGIMANVDLVNFPESCRDAPTPYTNVAPEFGSGSAGLDAVLKVSSIASYGFYCFAVVVTVPSLKGQMQVPSQVVKASVSAYGVCTTVLLLIMLIAYAGFGNLGPDNIIDGMRGSRPAGWWATVLPWQTGAESVLGKLFAWMIICNLLLTDGIYVPVTALAIEGWAPKFFGGSKVARIIVRSCLVLARLAVATEVKSFIDMTNLTSAAFCICNNILIPLTSFYVMGARVQKPPMWRQAMHGAIFIFGVVVAVFGSTGALKNIITHPASSSATPGVGLRPGLSEACKVAYNEATQLLELSVAPADLDLSLI